MSIVRTAAAPTLVAQPAAVAFALHVLFWAALAVAGFPATYWDDSLIVGPALALAESGALTNPYLSADFYPAETYLFYPPLFFWVLAGWVSVFGKTVLSLAMFWAACAAATSAATAVLLTRLGARRVAWVAAPVLVFGCIAYTGYRYEILAFAALAGGLASAAAGWRRPAYLLLFLTPAIAPTMLAAAAVAIVAILAVQPRERRRAELLAAAAALLLAVGLLVASVSGAIRDLVATMYEYREVRIGAGGRPLVSYRLMAVFIALAIAAAGLQRWRLHRDWSDARVLAPLLLALIYALTVVTHARPALVTAMNIAAVTLFAMSAADVFVRGRGAALGLGIVAAGFAALNVTYAAQVALRPLAAPLAERARAVTTADGTTLVVDPRIMKEALVFPAGDRIEDALVRHAWPDISQDFHRVPADERWLMTRTALVQSLPGHGNPASRGRLDDLFVAQGLATLPDDAICVIDSATSRRWRSDDPADLVALACR